MPTSRPASRRRAFPQTLEGAGWNYGIDDGFLRRFVDYWANEYDWRAAEARLNGFAQFTEVIDGETVHFVHVQRAGRAPMCRSCSTNGWPSNFVELLPLVPLLTEPVDGVAFDVVIPSLPGFGFSGQPTQARHEPHRGRAALGRADDAAGL